LLEAWNSQRFVSDIFFCCVNSDVARYGALGAHFPPKFSKKLMARTAQLTSWDMKWTTAR